MHGIGHTYQAMPDQTSPEHPVWQFICTPDETWIWRNSTEASTSAFIDLKDALEDAKDRGLDREAVYWTVQCHGRITHYRPGEPAVNLPNGEMPT